MSGYGDDTGLDAWLSANGLALPVGAPAKGVLRQIGSDYLDGAYEARLSCSRRTGGLAQERAFPRSGHSVGGETLPDDLIPQAWVNASYRAAYLHATQPGWAQSGTAPGERVKREKVGPIDTEYFGPSEGAQANAAMGFNVDPLIDGWVSLLLCPELSGDFAGLWAIGS